jgi:hypothetical protein
VEHLAANGLTSAIMPRFYEPDLGANPDSPFARDASGKLIRRSYWLDMTDHSLVMVMVNGIGAMAARPNRAVKRPLSMPSPSRADNLAAMPCPSIC